MLIFRYLKHKKEVAWTCIHNLSQFVYEVPEATAHCLLSAMEHEDIYQLLEDKTFGF